MSLGPYGPRTSWVVLSNYASASSTEDRAVSGAALQPCLTEI